MFAAIQTAIELLYPPRCLGCGTMVDSDFGLCGPCWRETPFIGGTVCDACGLPLPGGRAGERIECDDCMATPRPWARGRAALLYRDGARRMVLSLKHGDRPEIARPAARWLARAAQPFLRKDLIVAPVPLHWTRLMRRRFNQAALLSQAFARETGLAHCPDLLHRTRRTPVQEHKTVTQRFADLDGAITAHPRRRHLLAGRGVIVIDDVMTSGATFGECAAACRVAGAGDVYVLALARVAKQD